MSEVPETKTEITRTPLQEARRALMALRLEVAGVIADDVQAKVEAVFASLEADSARLDVLEEIGREGSIGVTKKYVLIKTGSGAAYFHDSLREAADAELARRREANV